MRNETKIAVIGAGSAGILSICSLLNKFKDDDSVKIYSLNDPAIPSVGIGESTNPVFWYTMWECLGVTEQEVFNNNYLDATVKHGTLYKNWRETDFLNPLFGETQQGRFAIHFNTFKMKQFVFDIIKPKYDSKFIEIQATVKTVQNINDGVLVLVDDNYEVFDYVIDCRGFPTAVGEEYNLLAGMPVNHCLVHNIEGNYSYDDWGHTIHQATEDGWMFAVPLRSRKSYGYLFNDTITTIDEAETNFAKLIGVDVNSLQSIEYTFNSYYAKKLIDGRIIKNGNLAMFLEPMFANSLWMYDFNINLAYDYIIGNAEESELNYIFNKKVESIRDLICYYYNGSNTFDTKFWQHAHEYSSNVIKESLMMKSLNHYFDFMKRNRCKLKANNFEHTPFSTDTLMKMDSFFGYNNWKLNDN